MFLMFKLLVAKIVVVVDWLTDMTVTLGFFFLENFTFLEVKNTLKYQQQTISHQRFSVTGNNGFQRFLAACDERKKMSKTNKC